MILIVPIAVKYKPKGWCFRTRQDLFWGITWTNCSKTLSLKPVLYSGKYSNTREIWMVIGARYLLRKQGVTACSTASGGTGRGGWRAGTRISCLMWASPGARGSHSVSLAALRSRFQWPQACMSRDSRIQCNNLPLSGLTLMHNIKDHFRSTGDIRGWRRSEEGLQWHSRIKKWRKRNLIWVFKRRN